MPNCTTRQTRQTNSSKLLKTGRFVPRSYSRFQFCSRASAGLIVLSTVACSIGTAPAQSTDIAAAQQCLAGFTSPKSDEELIVNIQKAWVSNTFAKDCLYSDENLRRLFGGTEIQWNEMDDVKKAGSVHGFSSWKTTGSRDEVDIAFSMRKRSEKSPAITIFIQFNNDPELKFESVVSVFGTGGNYLGMPARMDADLFQSTVPVAMPYVPHGDERIFYTPARGRILNLLFSSRANLYSLEIHED